jgi:integral membrane protein
VTTAALKVDGGTALAAYRTMANIVGVGLVLLFVSLPYRYWFPSYHREPTAAIGFVHGMLYLVLLASIANLAFRRRFPLHWIVYVALAGTVPFLSFVAERAVTARVRDGRL